MPLFVFFAATELGLLADTGPLGWMSPEPFPIWNENEFGFGQDISSLEDRCSELECNLIREIGSEEGRNECLLVFEWW